MADNIQIIKERLDLLDFLRSYLRVAPAGKNFKANCPFHKEKTPSFIISPDRQIWHCFGCSKGGDIIKFLMLYENIEFFEALKILGEKAGLDIGSFSGSDQRHFNILYEINQKAKEFFRQQLQLNAEAKNYLKNRGLTEATIEEFEIGFAPAGSDILARQLLKAGYRVAELEQSGLVLKTERGTYWDRFRSRIMFPLYNNFGRTVGFTGRILEGAVNSSASGMALAKYVNSPETPIFNKSKILFGFHKSKNAIREAKTAILVEGQMDFLMLWQDGIKNVIATSGTALTNEHLLALQRLADSLIINFDSDEAGQAATERAIDMAEANDLVVRVAVLEDKDAADFVKNNPGAIQSMFSKAVPALEYYLDKYKLADVKKYNLSSADAKRALRLVLGKIKNIYSPIEQGQWLKELGRRTGITEQLLSAEMQNLKSAATVGTAGASDDVQEEVLSRKEKISDQLINLAFFKKEFFDELSKELDFLPETHRQALLAGSKNISDVVLLRSSLALAEKDEIKATTQFRDLLRQLKLLYWREKQQAASFAIREAEQSGVEAKVVEALGASKNINQEIDRINKELQNL